MRSLKSIVRFWENPGKIFGKREWSRSVSPQYPHSCLVAELEGKVIGFILGEVSGWEFGVPDTIGWINTIGVDPAYQHRGVAKRLGEEYIKNVKRSV